MVRHYLAAMVALLLVPVGAAAQGYKISGVIEDGAGTGLVGVTIKANRGKERVAAITDKDGRFVLSVSSTANKPLVGGLF